MFCICGKLKYMAKLILAILMAAISASMLSIGAIMYLSSGDADSSFNQNFRPGLARYKSLRNMLGLNDPGDAASDFLRADTQGIVLEVDATERVTVEAVMLSDVANKLSAAIGKEVRIELSEMTVPVRAVTSEDHERDLVRQYSNVQPAEDWEKIYLLFAEASTDGESTIGSTKGPYSLLVYMDAIAEFSRQAPFSRQAYVSSTILHEIGHLLGLQHNSIPGCLMNSEAETDHTPKASAGHVVQNFCSYELKQISAKKQQLR